MPFDPRIIDADAPPLAANGDLDLPRDLAALAEQLADDSAHLATAYPPAFAKLTRSVSGGSGRPHTPIRRRTSILVVFTAASLAALLAGFVVLSESPISDPQGYPTTPSSPPQTITTTAPPKTIVSLTELSAPEVEAILDLMECSPVSTIRVSF